ncbi:MAG: hypothetical protein ACREQL_07315, partial [Candidatus Binatia bacterium]
MLRTRLDLALALVALLAVPALAAPPSRILWGADGAQGNTLAKLYQIDPTTGAAALVGPLGVGVTGLAVGHDGILYGATNTGTRGLVTIDRVTGAATSVGAFSPAANISDLTVSPSGGLFGWWDGFMSPKDLVVITPGTAAVTVVGDSMLSTLSGNGLAFCGDTLYLAPEGPSGKLYTIDPITGGAMPGSTLTGTPFAGESISALACAFDGTLFGAQLGVNGGSVDGQAHLIAIAAPATSGAVTDIGATVNKLDAIAFDEIRIDSLDATPTSA